MSYTAYMKHGDSVIKVFTPAEFNLRKSQGWKLTLKSEYEHANADSLPVLPGSPLDARQLAAPPAKQPVAEAGDVPMARVLDHVASELVTLEMEVAEALGLDRHTFLDADGPDALVGAVEAQRRELAAARAALAPFAEQWTAWQEFARNVGDVDIVAFFADCLEADVLARHLKAAYTAAQDAGTSPVRGAGEEGGS